MDEYFRRELERMLKLRDEFEKIEQLKRDIDPFGEDLRRLGMLTVGEMCVFRRVSATLGE